MTQDNDAEKSKKGSDEETDYIKGDRIINFGVPCMDKIDFTAGALDSPVYRDLCSSILTRNYLFGLLDVSLPKNSGLDGLLSHWIWIKKGSIAW